MNRLKGFAILEQYLPTKVIDPALQIFIQEHTKMKKILEQLLKIARQSRKKSDKKKLELWLEKEQTLKKIWDLHCYKEETIVFSLLTKYVEPQIGPLAVIEYEHRHVNNHLSQFEKKIHLLMQEEVPSSEQINEIYEHLHIVHMMLHDHFDKEERSGFILAQALLSDSEKKRALYQIKKIKVRISTRILR